MRKAEQRARQQQTSQGLKGLHLYRNRECSGFEALSPELRWQAQQLYTEYLQRHRGQLTQQRRALLLACACSNVKRLGDRAWARRLWRLKGYRRAERKQQSGAEAAAREAATASRAVKS